MVAAADASGSEVATLLARIGLEKYSTVLVNTHGMYTLDDLRQPGAKSIIAMELPLGPKARLLKELNRSEGEASAGGDEYASLIQLLVPYQQQLKVLVGKIEEACKRPGGTGLAEKQRVIARSTLTLCESAIHDSRRYQALRQRSSRSAEADMASVKIMIGSAVRQLRMHQQRGVLKELEQVDAGVPLPTLDLHSLSIGALSGSPLRRRSTPRRQAKVSAGLDHALLQRLRAFHNPPEVVSRTVLAFLRFFSHDEPSWAAARAKLGTSQLYVDLANFTLSDVNYAALTAIKNFYHDPDLSVDLVKAASTDAGVLCAWVRKHYMAAAVAQGIEQPGSAAEHTTASADATPEVSPRETHLDGDSGVAATPAPAARKASFADDVNVSAPHGRPTDTGGGGAVGVDAASNALLERERKVGRREEMLRIEEERVARERTRLAEWERSLKAAAAAQARRASMPTAAGPAAPSPPAAAAPEGMKDVLKQIDVLRGMLTARHGVEALAVDQELMAKVNAVHRAAATSRALLAHFAGVQREKLAKLAARPPAQPAAAGGGSPRRLRRGISISGMRRPTAPDTPGDLPMSPMSPGSPGTYCYSPTTVGGGGGDPMNGTFNTTMGWNTTAGGDAPAGVGPGGRAPAAAGVQQPFPDPLPLGSQVKVSVWKEGCVTGHARGRVGVEVEDPATRKPVHIGVPACQLRVLAEEEVDTSLYATGCWVAVGRQIGRVTGAARGRVGVELRNGRKLGVVPTRVRLLSEEEINCVRFPLGLTVIISETAVVTGAARGRIGLKMLADGSARGAIPEQLHVLPDYDGEYLKTLYPPGTPVIVKASGETGVVAPGGCARGRVGVVVAGQARGCLPDQIQRADSTGGVLKDFPVGSTVVLRAKQGEVVGHSRGRVGVELEDGTTIGAVADSLSVAELTDAELRTTYYDGLHVAVDGQRGRVNGVSRGRIGVTFDNGAHIGAMPDRVRIVTADELNRITFPTGLEVVVNEEAVVTGAARGRIGLKMTGDGSSRGAIPEHLHLAVPIDEQVGEVFPTGTYVTVLATGQHGVVAGTARGRVGVEVEGEAAPKGFLPHELRRVDSSMEVLHAFPVGARVLLRVVTGEVVGHSRGRVGVETDDGREIGVVPELLSMRELTAEEMKEKYREGMEVRMSGEACVVTGVARGRIGVEFEDGRRQGAVPELLVIPTENEILTSKFPVNRSVEVLQESMGTVVGKSRGRVGVLLQDGKKIGCLPEQLEVVVPSTEEAYPVTCAVQVTLNAKVTGHCRGRVGVQLNDGTNMGVLPTALVRVHSPEDFVVGSIVKYQGRYARIEGHSRGRVGIMFESGERKGVVPCDLERVQKQVATVVNLKSMCRNRNDKLQIGTLLDMAMEEHQSLVADVMCAVNDC